MYASDVIDSHQVFFSCDFFRGPPEGFTIEWTNGVTDGGFCMMVRGGKPCHEHCMKGVIVKLANPQRVWVLTGNANITTNGAVSHLHGYEAVWPD